MSTKSENAAALGALLARMAPQARPHIVGRAAALLFAAAGQMERSAVMECNGAEARFGESNESFSRRQDAVAEHAARLDKMARAKVAKAFDLLEIEPCVEFGGDPRGYVLKLVGDMPKAESNSFGGECYGIAS